MFSIHMHKDWDACWADSHFFQADLDVLEILQETRPRASKGNEEEDCRVECKRGSFQASKINLFWVSKVVHSGH